jgi:hypothetical protein
MDSGTIAAGASLNTVMDDYKVRGVVGILKNEQSLAPSVVTETQGQAVATIAADGGTVEVGILHQSGQKESYVNAVSGVHVNVDDRGALSLEVPGEASAPRSVERVNTSVKIQVVDGAGQVVQSRNGTLRELMSSGTQVQVGAGQKVLVQLAADSGRFGVNQNGAVSNLIQAMDEIKANTDQKSYYELKRDRAEEFIPRLYYAARAGWAGMKLKSSISNLQRLQSSILAEFVSARQSAPALAGILPLLQAQANAGTGWSQFGAYKDQSDLVSAIQFAQDRWESDPKAYGLFFKNSTLSEILDAYRQGTGRELFVEKASKRHAPRWVETTAKVLASNWVSMPVMGLLMLGSTMSLFGLAAPVMLAAGIALAVSYGLVSGVFSGYSGIEPPSMMSMLGQGKNMPWGIGSFLGKMQEQGEKKKGFLGNLFAHLSPVGILLFMLHRSGGDPTTIMIFPSQKIGQSIGRLVGWLSARTSSPAVAATRAVLKAEKAFVAELQREIDTAVQAKVDALEKAGKVVSQEDRQKFRKEELPAAKQKLQSYGGSVQFLDNLVKDSKGRLTREDVVRAYSFMQQGWTGEMLKSTVANIDKLKNYSPDRAVVAPLFASIAEEDKRNKAIDAAMTRLRVDFQKSLATTPLSEIAKMDDASVVRVHSNFTQSWALAGKDPIFAPVVQDKTRPEPSLIDRVLKKVQAGLLLDRVKAVAKVLNNQYVGMGLAAALMFGNVVGLPTLPLAGMIWVALSFGLVAGTLAGITGLAPEPSMLTGMLKNGPGFMKSVGSFFDKKGQKPPQDGIWPAIKGMIMPLVFMGLMLRIPLIWNNPIELYNDKEFFKYEKGDHDTELKIEEAKN